MQRTDLIGKHYNLEKSAHGGGRKSSAHHGHLKTSLKISAEEGVGKETVKRAGEFSAALDSITEATGGDPLEERVRNRLFKQRDHLFTFLDHEEVEATNNLAERQLRPAVIARKLSCGNKTPKGARHWKILTSLAATCGQRDSSYIDLVASAAVLYPAT